MNTTRKNRTDQIHSLKKCWLQITRKDWQSIIPTDLINQLLEEEIKSFRDRLFNPLVTLSMFILQVMDSDQSCRNAVANYLVTFGLINENNCSYNTSSYYKARKRLPEKLCKDLLRKSSVLAMKNIQSSWKWKGFNVNLVDGTTVTMPDTPANQSKYPQPKSQEAGLGFPIARLVTITSLSTGVECLAWKTNG